MAGFALSERNGNVVTIVLNNPQERNAIGSRTACSELIAALESAADDPAVSALVLTGAGEAFCSGGNLRRLRERSDFALGANPPATRGNYRAGIQRLARTLWDIEVPTIAAVNGWAVGLGCDLVCMCDIRYAADTAKFASSFVKLGLVPGDGGAWFLPRAVGFSKAAEMIFTGDTLNAQQALACGLVSNVVPQASLLQEAQALAQRIAAHPPQALRLTKRLLRESDRGRLDDVLELSAAFQALVQETEDHAEAVAAALARRAAAFVGR